jgi:site-specific recombinase XerD
MTQRVVAFKVEKASGIGALQLVRSAPGRLSPEDPLASVSIYLDQLAPSGRRSQRNNLERASRLLGGTGLDFDWASLRSSHLEFLRGALKGEKFAPSLINSTISALRGVARWAWHLGQMTERDYARLRDVRLVKAGDDRRRAARALGVNEIVGLFGSCERDPSICSARDAALITLLYAGGLRRDEACSLDVSAFARRSHTITVRGKGDRSRSVYFHDGGARRALNAWLRIRGDWPGPVLSPVSRHGAVICHALSASGLYRALERRAVDAGVDHFTPHDLRRSFGTHLAEEGTDIDLVRQLLGHVEITTTQRYIMRTEKAKKNASMKIHVPFRTRGKGGRKKRRRRGRKD